jgi:membrane fusion protein (multidrug efflux system)
VLGARAGLSEAEAELEKAKKHSDRMQALFKESLATQEDTESAETTVKASAAKVEGARTKVQEEEADEARAEAAISSQQAIVSQALPEIEGNRALLDEARGRKTEVEIRAAEVEIADGRLAEAIANLREAERRVSYAELRAPTQGRITKKRVEPGQIVQAGQPLFAIVNTEAAWVIANFKETQLKDVRPGMKATIEVDMFPGRPLAAHVDSIQAGTGGRFALLPPENASGNFVKVVQRVPVKLVIDEADRRALPPGASVIPTIELR